MNAGRATLQASAKAMVAAIVALGLAVTVSACDGSGPPGSDGARLTPTRPVAPIGGDPLPSEEVGRVPLRWPGGPVSTPTVPHAPAQESSPRPSTPSSTHPQGGAPATPSERIQTGPYGPLPRPEVEASGPQLPITQPPPITQLPPITPLPQPPELIPAFPRAPRTDTYIGPPGPRGACHCPPTTQQLGHTEDALSPPPTSKAVQDQIPRVIL